MLIKLAFYFVLVYYGNPYEIVNISKRASFARFRIPGEPATLTSIQGHVQHSVSSGIRIDTPLRIKHVFSESLGHVFAEYQDLVQAIKNVILPDIVEYFRLTFAVRKIKYPFTMERPCPSDRMKSIPIGEGNGLICLGKCKPKAECRNIELHANYTAQCIYAKPNDDTLYFDGEDGVGFKDTDFVLYLAANNSLSSAIAQARHCHQEPEFERPIMGVLYFGMPEFLPSQEINDVILQRYRNIIIHELIHTMAFSKDLMPYFRKPSGEVVVKRDRFGFPPIENREYIYNDDIIRVVPGTKGNSTIIVTPRLVKQVRKHFSCATIQGLPLEDHSDGIVSMHWEKRIMQDEMMTAKISSRMTISDITLAFIEDTGWYIANYENSGEFVFGKDAGCSFLQHTCKSYIIDKFKTKQNPFPYCGFSYDSSRKILKDKGQCSHDGLKIQLCKGTQQPDIPDRFKIDFSDYEFPPDQSKYSKNKADMLSDFCPLYADEKICSSESPGSYGSSNICLEIMLLSGERIFNCNTVKCNNNSLNVKVEGEMYTCHERDFLMKIHNSLSIEYFKCPDVQNICRIKKKLTSIKIPHHVESSHTMTSTTLYLIFAGVSSFSIVIALLIMIFAKDNHRFNSVETIKSIQSKIKSRQL